MLFKTTVNWLFNDIWRFFSHWLFWFNFFLQKTAVRVYYIFNSYLYWIETSWLRKTQFSLWVSLTQKKAFLKHPKISTYYALLFERDCTRAFLPLFFSLLLFFWFAFERIGFTRKKTILFHQTSAEQI